MGAMMHECDFNCEVTLDCGCIIRMCQECGLKTKAKRCAHHEHHSNPEPDYEYYRKLGIFGEDHIPDNITYVSEAMNALIDMGVRLHGNGLCLEIGAGTGRLVPYLLNHGYIYHAIEPSRWAANYVRSAYCVPVNRGRLEEYETAVLFDLVVAFHVLEHLENLKEGLKKIRNMMSDGGQLFLCVPDDKDLANPDHLWFFTPETMQKTLENSGFSVIGQAQADIVQHETFLYVLAEKK